MKTIFTRYHGPGDVRGARIVASDGDNRVIVSYDDDTLPADPENGILAPVRGSDAAHMRGAIALCRKLKWHTGPMIGGHFKGGMAWVFAVWGAPSFKLKG